MTPKPSEEGRIVRIVFLALLLDLLSFTIILPLFPRLLNFYQFHDTHQNSILQYLLRWLHDYKLWLNKENDVKWDTVILGGFIGSLFSLLQFMVSPWIGFTSDKYGRRKVLLWTMISNMLSTAIWLIAQSFHLFLAARILAGLSEGNVQLSIAIISDITSTEHRSKNMALVGIAFATAFTFGPPLGAWFASIDISQTWLVDWIPGLYPYSMAALVGLILLVIETIYLYVSLPETAFRTTTQSVSSTQYKQQQKQQQQQHEHIRKLNLLQCLFSFLFSGMEFTLVFLTFDILDYSHMQQGKLLGYMGILSAVIQGGYVRRRGQIIGERRLILQGMISGVMGLGCLAVVGMGIESFNTTWMVPLWLYGGVACLAMTSGTVVNSLTSLVSVQCEDHGKDKGKTLGVFRSFGQLGRACGPLSACTLYWLVGPSWCYGFGSMAMFCLLLLSIGILPHSPTAIKID
ncbi:major facilitator superfamily domain-containing protein [Halteromyces radiatus]|uniref:major facilitator superfamily domain-containing protein n=1 Tax=Halteromyces radiatus TaxID=101107 RepID=UPI00222058C1|nr:major facilitator superfamily domain-containing protein [Halteromyces radiatus]KAI8096671.1 major facilitator superfamily domain-containing protein [Halteromyces radiatus]